LPSAVREIVFYQLNAEKQIVKSSGGDNAFQLVNIASKTLHQMCVPLCTHTKELKFDESTLKARII